MGIFSRRESTTSPDSRTRTRDTSTVSTSRQASIRASCELGPEDRDRRFFQRGWLGSPRAESGVSTLASTPASPSYNATTIPQSIPLRTSSRDVTAEDSGFGHVRSNSVAQQLLSRGRGLKTSASKLSLSSMMSESTTYTRHGSDSRKRSVDQASTPGSKAPSPTRSISSPTEFQHMTHIEPQQFAKIQSTNESDLVADFSAMRASQHQRRDFRGIKTVELHSRNSSVETSSTCLSPSGRSSSQFTPSTSATSSSRSSQSIDQNTFSKSHTRKNRSQDSFSQPFTNGRPPKLGAPVVTPPRTSSRRAATKFDGSQTAEASRLVKPLIFGTHDAQYLPMRAEPSPSKGQEEATESSDDEYKTSEPSSPTSPNNMWPPASFGQALSIVDEEEAGPATAPRHGRIRSPLAIVTSPKSSNRGSRSEPLSSGSSSEESSATITAASYSRSLEQHCERQKQKKQVLPNLAGLAVPTVDQRISMTRSSLNQGLFTSWTVDDDDEDNVEQNHAATRKQKTHSSNPIRQNEIVQAKKQHKARTEDDEITALPSSSRGTMARSKSTKRSSKGSDNSVPLQRSKSLAKSSSKTSSTSKHDRHASEPPTSSHKDAKSSKKHISVT